MPTIYRISPDKITTRRVDPWHYQPKFATQIEKVSEHLGANELFKLIDKKRDVAGGATPLGANYLENGRVRFYRTSEVDELQLDASAAVFISDQDDEKLARSRLAAGDVVLTITGAKFGKSAVVTDGHLPGNISQHSVRFSPNTDRLDPYFLVSYLNGPTGQVAIWREAYGATRPAIDFPSVRSLTVPLVDRSVQKYIGDKVRQAERLRAWAKTLEAAFVKRLKQLVPEAFDNRATGKKYSRASVEDISYTLNPGAFDEERLRVQHYLLGHGGKRFGELAEISGPITNSYKAESAYIGLDAISSGTCQLTPSTVEKDKISGTCRMLGEGPVIAKLRPYLNKVSYIPKRLAGAVGSTELLCIIPHSHYSGWYLYGVLKSELTLKQLRPLATGATHPRIDQYDINDLVVPVLDDQEALGASLEQAQAAYFFATELTAASKLLVEALIEGQLTEAELLTAEMALQAGNDRLDRVILNRLNTDGIDSQGPALFGDLDELYHLLTQAEGD